MYGQPQGQGAPFALDEPEPMQQNRAPSGKSPLYKEKEDPCPGGRAQAFFDARNGAKAIQNRNRGGGNPLSWD